MGKRKAMKEINEEETEELTQENNREVKDDTEELLKDLDVYQDNFPKEKKVKKHLKALKMVSEAKTLVESAEEEMHSCQMLLESDLDMFAEEKQKLYNNGLSACLNVLKKVGIETVKNEKEATTCTVFEKEEAFDVMRVKSVTRSKFASFVTSITLGFGSAVALAYVATEKLGLTLDLTKVPSLEEAKPVLTWFSTWLNMDSFLVGSTIYGFTVLAVTYLIYKISRFLRVNANLHFAAKQLAEAELYKEIREDSKHKTESIDVHIKKSILMLERFAVFCNEQQGRVARIVFVEGERDDISMYNRRSIREIKKTQVLVEHVLAFLATPIVVDGRHSEDSIFFLDESNKYIDQVIEKLYMVRREDLAK